MAGTAKLDYCGLHEEKRIGGAARYKTEGMRTVTAGAGRQFVLASRCDGSRGESNGIPGNRLCITNRCSCRLEGLLNRRMQSGIRRAAGLMRRRN